MASQAVWRGQEVIWVGADGTVRYRDRVHALAPQSSHPALSATTLFTHRGHDYLAVLLRERLTPDSPDAHATHHLILHPLRYPLLRRRQWRVVFPTTATPVRVTCAAALLIPLPSRCADSRFSSPPTDLLTGTADGSVYLLRLPSRSPALAAARIAAYDMSTTWAVRQLQVNAFTVAAALQHGALMVCSRPAPLAASISDASADASWPVAFCVRADHATITAMQWAQCHDAGSSAAEWLLSAKYRQRDGHARAWLECYAVPRDAPTRPIHRRIAWAASAPAPVASLAAVTRRNVDDATAVELCMFLFCTDGTVHWLSVVLEGDIPHPTPSRALAVSIPRPPPVCHPSAHPVAYRMHALDARHAYLGVSICGDSLHTRYWWLHVDADALHLSDAAPVK
ncbi:hypothetical protein CDCA_CDCA17G4313 [Cyanidium caldarium]|uniref:Uncharacterized protein n=1 Tax=Cyanidium caldarium TaxID=2771 RepID=A0AAV9J115_CYACA|nr:hypothetical protein CDCA_CDCA17G4313 [Cyanidium caldarium]